MVKRVIYVSDGDTQAAKATVMATKAIGLGAITLSGGNPTTCTYERLLEDIRASSYDITVILFDDAGEAYEGRGEEQMVRLSLEEEIQVIGALAVASAERSGDWTKVDISVDRYGQLSEWGVDKEGFRDIEQNRVHGDTVYTLDQLQIPIVVGIGDLGKMGGRDDPKKGSPVTQTALKLILNRSGYDDRNPRANINERFNKE